MILPTRPEPFDCAVCGKHQDTERLPYYYWPIFPLCRSCEHGGEVASGYGYRCRYTYEKNPDRRMISQVRALADQLHFEAAQHART